MTYYAKPGHEAALYEGLVAQNSFLTAHHVQAPMLYRGPGRNGPAAFWTITFPSWAAHDAWLKSADAVPESASDKANDKAVDAGIVQDILNLANRPSQFFSVLSRSRLVVIPNALASQTSLEDFGRKTGSMYMANADPCKLSGHGPV